MQLLSAYMPSLRASIWTLLSFLSQRILDHHVTALILILCSKGSQSFCFVPFNCGSAWHHPQILKNIIAQQWSSSIEFPANRYLPAGLACLLLLLPWGRILYTGYHMIVIISIFEDMVEPIKSQQNCRNDNQQLDHRTNSKCQLMGKVGLHERCMVFSTGQAQPPLHEVNFAYPILLPQRDV